MPWLAIVTAAWLATLVLLVLGERRARQRVARAEQAYASASKELEHLQTAFHRFAPQDVVEDIIQRGVSTRGERRDVTVLFADLVGFTALSESMAPERVVSVLNGYFQAMTRAISLHNGHVSKFIGDGILATFGAPDPNPWQAQDAVRAALAMRTALSEYNATLAGEGQGSLAIGIGVHAGPVVAGVIGSRELVEYTVIGDVVNTASRVEGLTRRLRTDILVTGAVREHLDDRFRTRLMEPVDVKGKSEPVETWAVDGYEG